MSIQAMAWVFDHSEATGGERLVLLAVANHYDFNDPPLSVLAREARLSRSATIRAIARAEADGELVVDRDEAGGRSRTNRYTIPGYERSRNATLSPEEGSRSTPETVASHSETVASDDVNGRAHATRTIENHPSIEPRAPELRLVESQETAREGPYESEFNRAWALYPRKVARKKALAAYRATRRRGVPAEVLRAAVEAYAAKRAGQDEDYTMHGATFFGASERWKDFVPTETETPKPEKRVDLDALAERAAAGPRTGSRFVSRQPWEVE